MKIDTSTGMERFIKFSSEKALMLVEAGMPGPAIEIYAELHALVPHDAGIALELVSLYRAVDRWRDAEALLRQIIFEQPAHIEALYKLGDMLSIRGEFAEASNCFKSVVELDSRHSAAHNHLGVCLALQSRPAEAKQHLLEAIKIAPDYAAPYHNLGNLYVKYWRLSEAAELIRKTLELAPECPDGYNHLGGIALLEGNIAEALSLYNQALERDPTFHAAAGNILFALNNSDAYSDDFILQAQKRVTELYPLIKNNQSATFRYHEKIRIGYLSADFKAHSVGFFIEPVLRYHDHNSFEVFCYDNSSVADEVTERMMASGATWRKICGLPSHDICEQICQDQIDILIDLAGHTSGSRLDVFALQPSPVQVSWLGYPNTTCLTQIGFRLTDALADPPCHSYPLYTEKLVRLPNTFICYGPSIESPDVTDLPPGSPTFCCFNNLSKFSDTVLEIWSRVLKAVPNSKLYLKNGSLGDLEIRNRLIVRFAAFEIDPSRLILSGFTIDRGAHLKSYNACHIALDTFPYCGTTTTCEALWMGVPVISLAGNTHVSRVGKSILTNVGLSELVAENADEYVLIASTLAQDLNRLRCYRRTLREMLLTSPLTDACRFTADLEDIYRKMYYEYCCNQRIGV